jgi:hypothetical protein
VRFLFGLLSLAALGVWAFFLLARVGSLSAFDEPTLAVLQEEADRLLASEKMGTPAWLDADVTTTLISRERMRRRVLWAGLPVASAFAIAALFAPKLSRRPRRDRKEEARLSEFLGGQQGELAAEARKSAAELLGIAPNALPEVVEAAFQAQMRQRDPSRYDGVKPDLVKIAESQRQQLLKARELLLRPRRG